jgi:crossover junction endonuclease MUS81
MDDFCSSILDGRYKEQKFRLKKCGVKTLVYLIEEYGSMKHMSLPEKSLVQADVNTQIIDNLLVHHSIDPKDSASYLIEMTNFIIERYKDLTIHACQKSNLDDYFKQVKEERNQPRTYLLTLQEFNQFSNKNKPMTIREMFAKFLMKIQGVSQEKAIAIIDAYPTPAILFREYAKCGDENARVKLIANIKYGSQQRFAKF